MWNDSVLVVSARERMFKGFSWKLPAEYLTLGIYGTVPASRRGFSNSIEFRCAKSASQAKDEFEHPEMLAAGRP